MSQQNDPSEPHDPWARTPPDEYMLENRERAKKFRKADLAERVRLAMPIIRTSLLELGIGKDPVDSAGDNDDLEMRIIALSGVSASDVIHHDYNREDDCVDRLYGEAAYALGIAAGLFLRPELFAKMKAGAQ